MYWNWITGNWREISALALMSCGVWWLMPRTARLPKIIGLLLAIGGADWLVYQLNASGPSVQRLLFAAFATAAILAAILMITNRNPVYSALWFALATLARLRLADSEAQAVLRAPWEPRHSAPNTSESLWMRSAG